MMFEIGTCVLIPCSVDSLVDGKVGERIAYLSSKVFEAKDRFMIENGKYPTEVSIPIIAIPSWRDLVEQQRIGPWQGVREFLGMKVAYNTEYDGHRPLLIVRAILREEGRTPIQTVHIFRGDGS